MSTTIPGAISRLLARGRHVKNVLFSRRYLFFTNVAISISLSGVGDVLEQSRHILAGHQTELDRVRSRRMSITGCTVGILTHNWYMFLDWLLPGRSLRIVAQKLVLDTFIFSPLQITTFFLTLGQLEGTSFHETVEEIVEKGKILFLAEFVVWPPAQVINFYFIPLRYRVLYDNTISLGYDIFTSYIKYDHDFDGPEKTDDVNPI